MMGAAASILYLAVGVFDKGGIARYCRYQIRALRELAGKQNVRVLSFFGPGPNDFEEPFEVDWHANGPNLRSDAALLMVGAREAVMWRPSVIWSSHIHFMPTAIALRSLARGASLAVNVYGRELWSKRQWLHKRTTRRADMVAADCHFSGKFVVSDYGIAQERIRVVWDCVDTDRFRPRPRNVELMRSYGIPAGPQYRYLLTLGRIEERTRYKGYDRLLDALISLKERPEVIGIFAGDGNYRERLAARAREIGLDRRVFFLGSVPEDQLADVYNFCDVFSLVGERGPGRGEGIPLTPLEAAACGKPILVGDEDGSREAVAEGVSGRAISPRDPAALGAALRELLFDPALGERMGRAARRRIEEEFSYEGFRAKNARLLEALSAPAGNGRKP